MGCPLCKFNNVRPVTQLGEQPASPIQAVVEATNNQSPVESQIANIFKKNPQLDISPMGKQLDAIG